MKFCELNTNDAFDFIGPDRTLNSFFLRCVKISPRMYQDEKGVRHHIGSIYADVYNVVHAAK